MALLVQGQAGALSSMIWYRGDEIENDANYWYPFNKKGDYIGRMAIKTSTSPLIIRFTPLNSVNILGVILCIMASNETIDYSNIQITVELQESDDGVTWTTVRTKTITFPEDLGLPSKAFGRYMIDFRFDNPYPLDTTKHYRFLVYRSETGEGASALRLIFSKNAPFTSWTDDVSDYAFRIIYSDTVATPTTDDVFVITDELIIDQNWTVGYITIPTSPAKEGLTSYNNKVSFWICALGRLYVPSTIATDIKVEQKGRMYISAGYRVAWQIGDSVDNPIPPDKTVEWFFNCEGVSKRAGWYGWESSWTMIRLFGSPITKWCAELVEDAPAGQDYIKVKGDVTGEWKVGDKIWIAGTKYAIDRHRQDWKIDATWYEITSISYDPATDITTIYVTPTLTYMKQKGGKVVLLRRNVKIYGDYFKDGEYRADFEKLTKALHIKAYWVWLYNLRMFSFINDYHRYISEADYDIVDEFNGIIINEVHNPKVIVRREIKLNNVSTLFTILSGYRWNDNKFEFYKVGKGTIQDVILCTQTIGITISMCKNIEIKSFWIQSQWCIELWMASSIKIHDGVFFNSRGGVKLAGANKCEVYNVLAHGIYDDSNNTASSLTVSGVIVYIGDVMAMDNKFYDITIEDGAYSIVSIVADDGCKDWVNNVTYDTVTVVVHDVYRESWLEGTELRMTNIQTEGNNWVYFKRGQIHRTGQGLDDTMYRTEGGKQFAVRLEPIPNETFDEYVKTLTGCKKDRPVYYIGYIYVLPEYFDGDDWELPEIILEGLGIDYNEEPSARYVFPDPSYAGKWIPFRLVGTAKENGNAYVRFKVRSNGSKPYVYIDDDFYDWAEPEDFRSHEVWVEGRPADPPAVFKLITPLEIWSLPVNTLKAIDTVGRFIVEHSGIVYPKYEPIKVGSTVRIIFSYMEELTHDIRITIMKTDGTIVVNDQPMTKIAGTRYYYYDWTPIETGEYIVHVYSSDTIVKDATTVTVVDETAYDIAVFLRKFLSNRWSIVDNKLIIYDDDGVTPLKVFRLLDKEGKPTVTEVYDRVPE